MNKERLMDAVSFATRAHDGQFRKCGVLPYITHPLEVMKLLYKWGVRDIDVLIAAVLHDVVEDTSVKIEEIESTFGPTVSEYVALLTKQEGETTKEYLERFKNYSIEVCLCKAADRICNTVDYINSGDGIYANKYLYKAYVVWNILREKQDNPIVEKAFTAYRSLERFGA